MGYDVQVGILPAKEVVRARVNRKADGLFKLVADGRTGRLLGAHIVAEQAGEAIYAATLGVKAGLTVEDLVNSFAPYLTMSEGLRLAALAFSRDVARLSCCAG
jgi:mercuric reductase